MLWLIDYESAHWCGGQLKVVVDADYEDEACYRAWAFMDKAQRDLFQSEIDEAFEEEPDFDDSYITSVNSIELFDENHEEWKYFKDPSQAQFYPVIVAR